jgi:phosphatidylglycerophosphate synthase
MTPSVELRMTVVFLAALSDFLDGWVARQWRQSSSLGERLDPLCDKVFAVLALGLLWTEGALSSWGIFCLLSREVALLLASGYRLLQQWRGEEGVLFFGTCLASKCFTAFQMGLLLWLLVDPSSLPRELLLGLPLIAFWALCSWAFQPTVTKSP